MKRLVVLLALAGCQRPSDPDPLVRMAAVCEMETIVAELRWGRHLQDARRLVGEGRFDDAEQELWLAELVMIGGDRFKREQTRASRLDLRRRDSIVHIDCNGERRTVFRLPPLRPLRPLRPPVGG